MQNDGDRHLVGADGLAAAMLRGDPATWPPVFACEAAGEGCGLHCKEIPYCSRIGGFEKSRIAPK